MVKYENFDIFAISEYTKYLKPDFETVGDPFWMIMNSDGKTSIEQNSIVPNTILLFSSKKLAEDYKKENCKKKCNIIVVGVSQEHLKEIQQFNAHNNIHVFLTDFTKQSVELNQWDIDLYIRED